MSEIVYDGEDDEPQKGLVFMLIGDGKGKTTSALGMAIRAAGWNQRIIFIQFMKKRTYGEIYTFEKIGDGVEIYQLGREEHVDKSNPSEEDKNLAARALRMAVEEMDSRQYDWIFLDEVITAIDYKLISETALIEFLNTRPEYINIVLTGRGDFPKLIEMSDCVTRMEKIKHHYDKGIQARKGIEY